MKQLKAALITLALLFCWMVNGYADRLYTWTDAKGVTHITQDPPPDTAKSVDTIDYSPQPNRPTSRSTGSDQTNQQQGNLDQGGGQSGSDSGSGFTSADEAKEVQYEGDSYRGTLLRYEIKHKILDDHESEKDRLRPRKRYSQQYIDQIMGSDNGPVLQPFFAPLLPITPAFPHA